MRTIIISALIVIVPVYIFIKRIFIAILFTIITVFIAWYILWKLVLKKMNIFKEIIKELNY
jgi:hypothetical protein